MYPREAWPDHVSARAKRLGGGTYEEQTVPVESTRDYFRHFGVVGLDFTCFRPLLEEAGGHPTTSACSRRTPCTRRAPPVPSPRRHRPTPPAYLDADGYRDRFLALDTLGDRLAGVVFEQEYARVREIPRPEAFVAELDAFLSRLPGEPQTHLEVRSPHLLMLPYSA